SSPYNMPDSASVRILILLSISPALLARYTLSISATGPAIGSVTPCSLSSQPTSALYALASLETNMRPLTLRQYLLADGASGSVTEYFMVSPSARSHSHKRASGHRRSCR